MHQFQKKKIFDLKAERQKAKLPCIWATFQMPSTAEAGLELRQGLGIPPGSDVCLARAQALEP